MLDFDWNRQPDKGFFPYLCGSEILTKVLGIRYDLEFRDSIRSVPNFLELHIFLATFGWSCRFLGQSLLGTLRESNTFGLSVPKGVT